MNTYTRMLWVLRLCYLGTSSLMKAHHLVMSSMIPIVEPAQAPALHMRIFEGVYIDIEAVHLHHLLLVASTFSQFQHKKEEEGRRRRKIEIPLLIVSLIFLCFFSSALSSSVVTYLPRFQGPLPFYLETGYVEVDQDHGGEFFYYFIESENNPVEDPLLLWLTGGPRCSAFSGLVFEIAEYNGSLPSLVYHPYSWTKVANIIFVDSPLGSGFSYSRKYEGYDANDTIWSEQASKFLLQWLVEHPQFISNPLYIAGDSYARKIVPMVAKRILDGNSTFNVNY
ncbi:serine carboxypeptidase-like 15 [Zingiber officinale]|uniref:serine carboxypeptidase-like 15 n=1 Tax=Zingiber officinale TaxID=94328 RepID=UPI001C4DD7E7|nr:serine carboxypeptidase-like 15 [Zingiber officinale]